MNKGNTIPNFTYKDVSMPYGDALDYYKKLQKGTPNFLYESSDATDKKSRLSMIGIEPFIELKAQNDICVVSLKEERGRVFFDFILNEYANYVVKNEAGVLELHIPNEAFNGPENERFLRVNTGKVIRDLLIAFKQEAQSFFGIYGALGYRFIYMYEEVEACEPSNEADYHLFVFDNVLFFNHLTRDCRLYCTRQNETDAAEACKAIKLELTSRTEMEFTKPSIKEVEVMPKGEIFKKQVQKARDLCEQGELMELVLCRKITGAYKGDTLPLYERYRKVNPAPYLFHLQFEDETLLGASPEIMIRYENGRVVLRPISGTIRKGRNAIEDHYLMMELLNDPKEKSELDMLIDLGRNDLTKVCKSGVQVDTYRAVEKYSHVMHTVAQVSGELQDDRIGLDALVASLNAGTLSGTPKVMAMNQIEKIEQHERGYYGGCVGYLLFNGDVNTGIVIRSAHIKNERLDYCSGATLLYESQPQKELEETDFKAAAFLKAVEPFLEK